MLNLDFSKRLNVDTVSPHMSVHHPFVDEETFIWVKTGHLPAIVEGAQALNIS